MLDVDIGIRLDRLELDVAFRVADGEVLALLGPNGAGKTTTLRAIAGLLPIDRGHINLDGDVLDDPAAGVLVPTVERPIGVVFQDNLLFPRMTALDNVAFGLRARGARKAEARARAAAWLGRVGLTDHAGARPRALSGGQAQRVALARALITEPRLLLLDEPLAALDASARLAVRTDLRHHLAGFAGGRLLVTHDPLDAIVLADRLAVIEDGRITQHGPTEEVARRPATRYIADLLGLNLLHGDASGTHTVTLASGAELTVADTLPAPHVAIAIRPQAVTLHRHRPEGSARNAWPATVVDLHADRDRVRVAIDGDVPLTVEVTPAAVAELDLVAGTPVWATVKAVDLTAYPRGDG